MTPRLLAEAPGRGVRRPFRPLDGRGGTVLAGCARLTLPELLESFETVNLLGRWPGPRGKGSAWDRAAAQRAARRTPLRGVTIVLGRRVMDAYASTTYPWLKGAEWGEWRVGPRGQRVAALPHPSGINQLYNNPEVRALVGRVLREAMEAR